MAAAARHELRGEYNQSQTGQDSEVLRQLIKPYVDHDDEYGKACRQLTHLLNTLRQDLQRFQDTIEEIRLLDTNPRLEIFDLFSLLDSVRGAFLSASGRSRRRVVIEVDPALMSERVRADRNHIELVFHNLIRNSLRSTEKCAWDRRHGIGGDYVERIYIGKETSMESRLNLMYRDNGGGMSEEFQQQLYQCRVTDQPGADHGLGGIIIKKLLTLNNGDIGLVDSSPAGTRQHLNLVRVAPE